MKLKLIVLGLIVGGCSALAVPCRAAEKPAGQQATGGVEVELFAAVKSGQLQVAVVPHKLFTHDDAGTQQYACTC